MVVIKGVLEEVGPIPAVTHFRGYSRSSTPLIACEDLGLLMFTFSCADDGSDAFMTSACRYHETPQGFHCSRNQGYVLDMPSSNSREDLNTRFI